MIKNLLGCYYFSGNARFFGFADPGFSVVSIELLKHYFFLDFSRKSFAGLG